MRKTKVAGLICFGGALVCAAAAALFAIGFLRAAAESASSPSGAPAPPRNLPDEASPDDEGEGGDASDAA